MNNTDKDTVNKKTTETEDWKNVERDMSIGAGDIEFITPTPEQVKEWAEQDAKLDLSYYDRLADLTPEEEEELAREWQKVYEEEDSEEEDES